MYVKRLYLFFLLLTLSLLLMTAQVKIGPINPFDFLSYHLNTINDLLHQTLSLIKTPVRAIKAVTRENERLKREVAELKLRLRDYGEIKRENERLKELVGLKTEEPRYIAAAGIINRGYDRWSKTVIADKGADDGIRKDMIGISPEGLAGKIVRIWPSYSEVLLITDSSFSVSVRLQDSRVEGILTGSGGGYCMLNYVSNEIDVKAGDVLVTSGLDLLFPKGVPVGKVKSARKTSPELFQYIEVAPFIETKRLEEVTIIRK